MVAIPVTTHPAKITPTGPSTLTCDCRCPAKALETWMHEATGYTLFMCLHHGRQHTAALVGHGFTVVESAKAE